MPCYGPDGPSPLMGRRIETEEDQEEIDDLTRMLCELMGKLDTQVTSKLRARLVTPELGKWWKSHQKLDQQRKDEERRLKEQKRLRQRALSKLSPKERRALGLDDDEDREDDDEDCRRHQFKPSRLRSICLICGKGHNHSNHDWIEAGENEEDEEK